MRNFDHTFFQEQGFCIVDNIFTSKQCDALIAASQELPSYKDGTLTPVMNPHFLHEEVFQAMRCEKIIEILEGLFSGPVSGLQSQFFYCRPGTPGFSQHQDNFYVQAKPEVFGSAWVALDDVTPENGGLVVFPGSHTEEILPTEAIPQSNTFGQDPNAVCQQALIPKKYSPIDLCVDKGGVVFIHGHLVHSSHNNSTENNFRHALLLTYIRKGEAFRSGFSAKRQEISLSKDHLHDRMLQGSACEHTY